VANVWVAKIISFRNRNNFLMKKYLIIFIVVLMFPLFSFAHCEKQDTVFRAVVQEIIMEKETELADGAVVSQQDIKLKSLEEEFSGEEIIFRGIDSYDVVKKTTYKEGDKVLVVASFNDQGEVTYYVTDYIRDNSLILIFVIFVFVLLLVGRFKGLRAVLSLVLSFLVIVKYIIPQILSGADPIIVTIIGSLAILLVVVYLTEGVNKKSHIASLSIFVSLVLTIILSVIFVSLAKLSGLGSEEISFLINLDGVNIDFKGLLLAGIIIGTLGVLDDVVISQIATVEQLYETDKQQSQRTVYKKAYTVGVSHISSMANTLFLAYAGASLPLLVLFVSGESAFAAFGDVLNNEAIATEVVRTLAGSIGLVLTVPISTFLAVIFLKER